MKRNLDVTTSSSKRQKREINQLKRKYNGLLLHENKRIKFLSNQQKMMKEYTCIFHDNDINICNIYECSGIININNQNSSYIN